MATEQKWNRYSGLVMLLPHGYEGQGPEHSSARLERFLQLCAEDNVVVANVTTPANFFHLMRRQMLRTVRKPLVVMSPKSLLRHPKCISTLEELSVGGFQKMLMDPMLASKEFDSASVEHVVFCSGKIYYDLLEHREMIERYQDATDDAERAIVTTYLTKFASFNILKRLEAGEHIDTKRIVLTRVEQLYPFPESEILTHLSAFNQPELHWCQEEPKNMGAWPMVDEWFSDALNSRVMGYIGRKRSASPATGSPKIHKAEQASIVEGVFSL
jgi:2-oxoglutarate dehydrogenase E1 component